MGDRKARPLDVIVYGATGFTGELACRELCALGVERIGLAGRDAGRLEAVAGRLGRPPAAILEVGLDDDAELERVAGQARVLVSCAGPFARLGGPVRDAALRAGTHYVDVTGEVDFMRETVERCEVPARAAGVTLINAMGVDVVPTDLAIALACAALDEPAVSVSVGLHVSRFSPSRGTRLSAAAGLGSGLVFEDGRWQAEAVAWRSRVFEFPEPIGRQYGVSAPLGDVVTGPRTSGAQTVIAYAALDRVTAALLHGARRLTPLLGLRQTQRALGWLAGRGRQGPTLAERRRQRFSGLAVVHGESGRRARALVSGRDPYGFTGRAVAVAAAQLASPDWSRPGVLTPSQAFEASTFLTACGGDFELSWRVL